MPFSPIYGTPSGAAYLGDSIEIMQHLREKSVALIVTSPPFPLTFQKRKPYEAVGIDRYVDWFLEFGNQFRRVLKDDGSLVIDIGGVWVKGTPTRSLYQYHLLLGLCEKVGFHFAQDFYWYNPASLPAPAEWVNVRRIRVKAAVNHVWWLSKTAWPKADNRHVLRPYSDDMVRLIRRGYRVKNRPSGHAITAKFGRDRGGAIPPNLLEFGNNDSNGVYIKRCLASGLPVHPARFPRALPDFFVRLCTESGDLVVDPFAGSNVTGEAAERLGRRWVAIELIREYLEGSRFRFEDPDLRQQTMPFRSDKSSKSGRKRSLTVRRRS
ncbi:MAG: DNA-methyltransferase [Candidatus Rokuibacteriota bacterium]